jgi:hypothetical protein
MKLDREADFRPGTADFSRRRTGWKACATGTFRGKDD